MKAKEDDEYVRIPSHQPITLKPQHAAAMPSLKADKPVVESLEFDDEMGYESDSLDGDNTCGYDYQTGMDDLNVSTLLNAPNSLIKRSEPTDSQLLEFRTHIQGEMVHIRQEDYLAKKKAP